MQDASANLGLGEHSGVVWLLCTTRLTPPPPVLHQLALILLEEKVQARSSRFADYLAVLPREVDVPVLWSDSELQQLRCAYFIEQVGC